jgi:mitogen-activated protein kinase kinase kinase 7
LKNKLQTLKIADFGLVREIDNDIELTRKIGTIVYMAPEVFSKTNYTTKCDVYSFGITIGEMYTRKKPYSSQILAEYKRNLKGFIEKISKIDSPLRPNRSCCVPETISIMIER